MSRLSLITVLAIPMLAQVDVLTRHNDGGRIGANLQETQLTVASVSGGNFGKLVASTVDGNPYAQPLIVSGARVPGRGPTEMVVATEHNSVYAFDGNDIHPASATAQIWHTGPNVLGKAVDSQQLYRFTAMRPVLQMRM